MTYNVFGGTLNPTLLLLLRVVKNSVKTTGWEIRPARVDTSFRSHRRLPSTSRPSPRRSTVVVALGVADSASCPFGNHGVGGTLNDRHACGCVGATSTRSAGDDSCVIGCEFPPHRLQSAPSCTPTQPYHPYTAVHLVITKDVYSTRGLYTY